ncbi:UDP-N-acetylglucosamine 1-carboxyvinyltransferase [Alkalicaulis satelles]|uniref:UDP-N-acetylglucosamine 1-carboxyvinyltransferase n=1 Tax=Alkalicaulis satelles TaxID=2609175 RepID=A0A5M6ZIM6_9PROT|nr:UDP-N-acetylglucosamine 1-carboxyvinyltransferase [Alkalicaulis satelles]KAA5804682.1 UDP-N-acetylglucosamine 1-carboxyvinyltransferase [Alkalicaulis satelles]
MDQIVIRGGRPLQGVIPISGAKNSALKLMAAALLTDGPLVLSRMPRLADVRFLGQLLARLGVEVEEQAGARLRLHARDLNEPFAPYDLVRKMRASFNVLGPLIARQGRARVSLPGGCAIGARPVNLHLMALEALGAEIELSEGYVNARAPKGLTGAHIVFPMVSVGATEHAMLAAVLARGQSVLEHCAREPEIADLAGCLNAMGAKITGAGTDTITIEGVERLNGADWTVTPDRIETGTYAIAAAAAGGRVRLEGVVPDHNHALWDLLGRAGVEIALGADHVDIARSGPLRAVDMQTEPFPGFPTDVQAQYMALMTQADGASVIRETIFENRFMHAPELARLGARIDVRGNEAIVRGPVKLKGAQVMATDLRASVSLVIAALAAEGETVVSRIYHLDRGFERLEDKLSACGADIARRSEETA